MATGLSFSVLVVYMLHQQGLSPAVYGLGATVAAVLGLVAGPAIGTLADRVNGCVLYACLMWTMALATLALTVASPLVALGLLGVLVMSARGSAAILAALVGRAVERERRLRFRAVVRAMSNVAMIVGLGLGAVVLALDSGPAFRASFVLEGVALLVVGFLVWRLRHPVAALEAAAREAEEPARADGEEPARGVLRDPRVVALMVTGWLFFLAEPMLTIAVPLWVGARMDVPLWIVSVALVVNTLGVVFFQVPVARRVTTVWQAARAAQWGAALFTVAAVMFPVAAFASDRAGVAAALGAVVLLAVALVGGNILTNVGSTGLLYEIVPQRSYGKSQGVYGMGFDVASLTAPALFGWFAAGGGPAGWYALGVLFLASVLPVRWVSARTAAANDRDNERDPAATDVSAAPAA
ncbi:MFS transporter [Streptomyces sedi]